MDLKPFAAEREHLGHKRHPVELPVTVECPQDFFLTSNLHPVSYAQFTSLHVYILSRIQIVSTDAYLIPLARVV
jgi:hypothetical protein